MKTLKEMLAEARQVIPEQGPADLKRRLDAGESLVLIDVRDPDEYRDGSIESATNISRGFLEFRIGAAAPDPDDADRALLSDGPALHARRQGAPRPGLSERGEPAGRLSAVGAVLAPGRQGQAAHHASRSSATAATSS